MRRWFEFDFGPADDEAALLLPPAPGQADLDTLEALHAARVAAGDAVGASAAVAAAVTAIWAEGRDFTAFGPWLERIDDLLAHAPALHPVVLAALAQHRLIAGMLGGRPLGDLLQRVPAARLAADESRSGSLRIVSASLEGALRVLRGDFHRAEECVCDAIPLAADCRAMPNPQLFLANCVAMIGAVRDLPSPARMLLETTLPDAAASPHRPLPLVPLIRCHRLLALARHATEEGIDAAADEVRALVIPSGNRHLSSYLHYALGVAALLRDRPAEALDHAQLSAQYAAWCTGSLTQAMSALLEAQALADLARGGEALGRLEACMPRWEAAGYGLFRATALLECAKVHLHAGRVPSARSAVAAARACLPGGAALPDLGRPAGFAARLAAQLLPAVAAAAHDRHEVSISTFGELRVRIGRRHIFDRDWHGSRTKSLLKALIVLGGRKISLNRLCDLLWPDAEGDHARNNLKVALSRLRHLGTAPGDEPVPWIVTQQGQVSLVSALCHVDAIAFRDGILRTGSGDHEGLAAALDLYRADFLQYDDSEPWIVAHRDLLRRQYVRAAQRLARDCLLQSRTGFAEPYLERAVDLDPHDDRSRDLLTRLQQLAGDDASAPATATPA